MSAVLFDRALTTEEMDEISAAIESAYDDPAVNPAHAAATRFYCIAARELGFDTIDAMADAQPEGTFKATAFTIAEAQWHLIGEMILTADRKHRTPTAVDRVNSLLDWMNTGPSARVMEVAHGH